MCGPDGIPSEVYKQHREQWAVVLSRLFNAARWDGELPAALQDGVMTILHKKGDPRLLSNYRLLTLLCRSYVCLATAIPLVPAGTQCHMMKLFLLPGAGTFF